MTIARKGFSGTAVPSSLNGAIAAGATTIVINATTGWPDGTNGKSPAKIDPGLPTEEDILFTARSGNNLTTVSRAQNGTVAASHANGAVIIHGWSAGEADEVYQHLSDTEATPHPTKLLSPTAHTAILHTVGTTLPALGTAQNLGDTADGSGASLAGGNHTHGFPVASTYTPTITGFTLGNGTIAARYIKAGKLLWVSIHITIGSTTVMPGGTFNIPLPSGLVGAGLNNQILATQVYNGNAGGGCAAFTQNTGGTSTFAVSCSKANAISTQAFIYNAWPAAWSNGDFIAFSGFIEVA